MGILPLALISFPMWIGNSFENKSIERLNFFGVNTSKMFVGDVLANFILAMISMAINILVAFLFWRLKFPSIGHFLSFIIQYFIAIVMAMIIGDGVNLLSVNELQKYTLIKVFNFSIILLSFLFHVKIL